MMTIPAGWKMVPIEPTKEMLDAEMVLGGYGFNDECFAADPKSIWSAMLAAAPTPPKAVPLRATLDEHCDHVGNVSADGKRCLSCGAWISETSTGGK